MRRFHDWAIAATCFTCAGVGCSAAVGPEAIGESTAGLASTITNNDDFGQVTVFSTADKGIDLNNPFFQNLGTNGRTCNSCHKLENAMGISVANIQAIFNATQGTDPIFRINDGSNAPTGFYSNTSSLSARKTSFSMLLNHGTIRVGQPVPSGADFHLAIAQDPYYFASASELSLFRRPLPSVNVAFDVSVMWDGRESEGGRTAVRDALMNQANDATTGHAQRATPLDSTTRGSIADFQLHLFASQTSGTLVGALNVAGCVTSAADGSPCDPARGDPQDLSRVLTAGSPGGDQGPFPAFFPGINDPAQPGFLNISFTPFDPWESKDVKNTPPLSLAQARGDIGDGENLFYTAPMTITGVPGFNDVLGKDPVQGFCTSCHNTPDVGTHSVARFFNTGVASPYLGDNPLAGNIIDFPKYTIARNSDGVHVTTTDPGLALRTGKYADVGKFKTPQLRGLGSRAPYFHNGEAKTLNDVVNFYNTKFKMNLTSDQIRQIVLFLQQT